jgi:hypothetical protein
MPKFKIVDNRIHSKKVVEASSKEEALKKHQALIKKLALRERADDLERIRTALRYLDTGVLVQGEDEEDISIQLNINTLDTLERQWSNYIEASLVEVKKP